MRKRAWCAAAVLMGMAVWSAGARGAIQASGSLTTQQLGPSSWEYNITLHNTGTTNIGSFWFAWIPGYDMLPSSPTFISSPAGWTGVAMHEAIGVDSIQWVGTGSPIGPGGTLGNFVFRSPDSPAAISGTSQLNLPVEYSYVYIGGPELDPGFLFTVQTGAAVPEPGMMGLAGAAGLGMLRRRRR